MASFSQPRFFSFLTPIKNTSFAFSPQPRYFFKFKYSKISALVQENSSESEPQPQPDEEDPLKLAFSKSMPYKNFIKPPQGPPQETSSGNIDDSPTSNDDVNKEVPLAVKLALEKAKGYKKSKIVAGNEGVVSKIVQDSGMESAVIDERSDGEKTDNKDDGKMEEIPLALKLALEKAKEYKKNTGVVDSDTGGSGISASGLERADKRIPGDNQSIKSSSKKGEFTVSSIDFMGLGFADKKTGRSLPAGLVPQSDPFPEGDLPEVEILVGDTSKFGDSDTSPAPKAGNTIEENDDDLYKPKVSTWGVFPRPNDISKTYGGGRNIRPGEALETTEERAAKQARTRQLVAAYKSKIGLNIDPKLKSECEKALKDGDSLMNLGKLKQALPFYERVMEKLVFQSELHGLAALQWSICQDSLSRPNEAHTMYEKLQSHPSPRVSKKARQLFFSFQAMEMMRVASLSRSPRATGYQNYFDAFVQDKTSYPSIEAEVNEIGLNQAIPYVIFLASPILLVLLIAASRS